VITQTVLDSMRNYSFQSRDGASSVCCWLKSCRVCDSDVMTAARLLLGVGGGKALCWVDLSQKQFQLSDSNATTT